LPARGITPKLVDQPQPPMNPTRSAETEPTLVEFPLRGEWTAFHTPAERIPSHGTDQLAQRYAFDFVKIDRSGPGWKFYGTSPLRYNLFGTSLADCYAWGEAIHAPFDGRVIAAKDGWPERKRLHFVRDMAVVIKNSLTFDPNRPDALKGVLGNYVIVRQHGTDVHALMAHARMSSVRVREGDEIAAGEHVADVGHSGNSTAPHLHFQLMNGPDLRDAVGVPCAFRQYEALHAGRWSAVSAGIPGKREFVRYLG
jgi:murein DD-endopeptidase MepM/ murein hydrolase activator NlpD